MLKGAVQQMIRLKVNAVFFRGIFGAVGIGKQQKAEFHY